MNPERVIQILRVSFAQGEAGLRQPACHQMDEAEPGETERHRKDHRQVARDIFWDARGQKGDAGGGNERIGNPFRKHQAGVFWARPAIFFLPIFICCRVSL